MHELHISYIHTTIDFREGNSLVVDNQALMKLLQYYCNEVIHFSGEGG